MDQDQAAPISPAHDDDFPDVVTLREQRELALACFILSATLSLAVLLSNFGSEPREIGEARAAVDVHQKLLVQEKLALVANQKALGEVERARDELLRARVAR